MAYPSVDVAVVGFDTLAAGLFEGILPDPVAGIVVLSLMGLMVLIGLLSWLSLRSANKNLREQIKMQEETREAVIKVAKICEQTYKNQRDVSEGLLMLNRMVQKKSSTPSGE